MLKLGGHSMVYEVGVVIRTTHPYSGAFLMWQTLMTATWGAHTTRWARQAR